MDNRLKKFYKDKLNQDVLLSDTSKQKVRESIFSRLNTTADAVVGVSFWERFSSLIGKSYIVAPLVFLLFIAGTTIASADAAPGDKLYKVKRQVEKARLFVAPTENAKLDLQVDFAENRLEELQKIEEKAEVKAEKAEAKLEKAEAMETKARVQAEDAKKFLNETKENLEKRGNSEQKAKQMNERVNKILEESKSKNK